MPLPPDATASLLSGPRLALLVFAALMLLCMPPAWLCASRDSRRLRGVGVWVKPLKFMAAVALFSFTTAVLMLAVPDPVAAAAPLRHLTVLLIATAAFEVSYITVQASRAEESHYNIRDPFHLAMNVLMAVGAVGMTASQAWLALVIVGQDPHWMASVTTLAVVTGLMLTWLLATVSGFMLGGKRAPAGIGMPVVGWHRRADLRPAHFLGVHVQQFVPLFGLLAAGLPQGGMALFATLTLAYLLAWLLAIRAELKAGPLAASGAAS